MAGRELLTGAPGVGAAADPSSVTAALARMDRSEPLSRALAAYLSARPDLLSIGECLTLGEAAVGTVTHLSPAALRGLFAAEIGRAPDALLDSFEIEPYRVDHLFQWHWGQRHGGEPVTVKVRHANRPSVGAAAFARRALSGVVALAPHLEALAEAFERRLQLAADLAAEGRALVELREAADRPRSLSAPAFFAELSSGRILTRERLAGAGPVPANGRSSRGETRARRLSKVWLGQVLAGSPYPLEPAAHALVFLPAGDVSFVEGPFGSVSDSERETLVRYLTAVAAEEHERAAELLLETSREPSRRLEEDLRHHFRHVAPFRDGGWIEDGDRLARLVLAQWRLATELGTQFKPGVVDFFAGFFRLTDQARRIAPGSDVVSTGFQELRLRRIVTRLGRLVGDDEGLKLFERQLETMIELPPKLDRLLDLAVREAEFRRRPSAPGERPRRQRPSVLVSLLVALATTALLVGRFGASTWAQGLGAVAILVIGTLFLLTALRES